MNPILIANHWPAAAFFLIYGSFAAFVGLLFYLQKRSASNTKKQ